MADVKRGFIAVFGGLSIFLAAVTPIFFFVNIPCQDDWILVPLIDRILSGSVTFQDFWALHNEHRLLFPKLILAYWASWTSWDLRGLPWLDLALVLLATGSLANLFHQPNERSFLKSTEFWCLAAFTFSLRAVKCIQWPIMFSVYLS